MDKHQPFTNLPCHEVQLIHCLCLPVPGRLGHFTILQLGHVHFSILQWSLSQLVWRKETFHSTDQTVTDQEEEREEEKVHSFYFRSGVEEPR